MKLSIRYKILAVVSVLLLSAIGFYTLLASSIFQEEKTALLYDLNHSLAINTASQLDGSLRRVADQVKLYAISRLVADKSRLKLSARYLQDAHVIAAELYKKTDGGFTEFKLPAEVPPTQLDMERLKPFLEEAQHGEFAFWNQPVQEQLPRYFLASRFDIEIQDKVETFVAVAELDSKPFFEPLQQGGLFQIFVFRNANELLFRCDHGRLLPPTGVTGHPLLKDSAANVTGSGSGVQSFEFEGQKWYGAFAPVGIAGLSVLSQASHREVTAALSTLVQRSLLFGLIVVTVTFIASVLFSKRLTRGLKTLANGAERIGRGDLKSTIDVRSGDEVETVAASFNAMVEALRASREAIEKYNRELEDKVALRTKQLQETNAAIKEVQEKLLRTTQLAAVGEVAGRTAHELLNPLTAILSRLERSRNVVAPAGAAASTAPSGQMIDILTAWETDFRKGGISELMRSFSEPSPIAPQQTLLEEDLENLKKLGSYWQQQTDMLSTDLTFVQDQAQRIHRIVDRMREYVRSSVKSEVHCHEAVNEAAQTMADYLAKNGITLEKDLIAQSDLALLNRDELVQIVSNLMRNSLQAMGKKEMPGKIRIATRDAGSLLTIDIIDNGVGIPKEKQRFLFEQGFTTKGPSEGTGLGLAICRRYARAFGGEVELLYSEPEGRGTCFRISIPLQVENTKAAS